MTRPVTPVTSLRPTVCVKAACWDPTVRRVNTSAALRSTLPPSSWRGPALASQVDTPTPRSTCPWPWAAPASPSWTRRGTRAEATRVWTEPRPKLDTRGLWERRCRGSFSTWESGQTVALLPVGEQSLIIIIIMLTRVDIYKEDQTMTVSTLLEQDYSIFFFRRVKD